MTPRTFYGISKKATLCLTYALWNKLVKLIKIPTLTQEVNKVFFLKNKSVYELGSKFKELGQVLDIWSTLKSWKKLCVFF